MQEVNIVSAKQAIKELISVSDQSIMLWGQPGLGKSEIIFQIGEETGRDVYDVRLLLRDPTDLKGIPYYNAEQKSMCWAEPTEFKYMKENSILFLDEISSAPPLVQAVAYQLVLDKKIGEFSLPKGVKVIAAGNRDKDNGVTYEMPSPLSDRFIHIELKGSFNAWVEGYAAPFKVDERVVSFLFSNQHHFNNFEEDGNARKKTFTTPRSWARVNELVLKNSPDANGKVSITDQSFGILMSGIVGEGIAAEYSTYIKDISVLPSAEDVLQGKNDWEKKLESIDLDVAKTYSLIISMCYWLRDNRDHEGHDNHVKNYFGVLQNHIKGSNNSLTDELIIAAVQMATARFNVVEFSHWKKYGDFIKEYSEYINS